MRRFPILALVALFSLPFLSGAGPAMAQPVPDPTVLEPAPKEGDVVIWYRVQEGDTLYSITETYLGTYRLWQENRRLNPSLPNPNNLRPGQWLRIIESRPSVERFAEFGAVAGDVQALLYPSNTKAAKSGDRLVERDGVQTAPSSSTQLRFDDESRLDIGERSLVFLEVVDQTLAGVRREMIEIRRGQAEISTRAAGARDDHEIEIRVGGARTRPEAGPGGRVQTRAKADPDGGAQVMVYDGKSVVEAAGASVAVPKGMGSSVPESGPPSPPEKLLPAPKLQTPAPNAAPPYANPDFRWQSVQGAASYTLEFCEDPSCTRLLLRREGLVEARWDSAEAVPVAAGHWRVTAVSASALDGYPSTPRPLLVESTEIDREAPVVVARLVGAGRATEGRALLGPGAGLTLDARDDVGGVADIRYRWNGGSWVTLPTPWTSHVLRPPATADSATLELSGIDVRGRITEPVAIEVVLDTQAPPAPTPSWQPATSDTP